jgi:aspartate/methionine/tyrosine aminotransferase
MFPPAMNPLATDLNRVIERCSPDTFALLSERGKRLFWPRGILFQSAEAKEKAHRFNATIGEATEGSAPMSVQSVIAHLGDVSPADGLRYAPAQGKPDLRRAWREKLLAENPAMRGRTFGDPIVTSAITHGLSIVGDLFVDPGDVVLLPDMLWDNYLLAFETSYQAQIRTYPTYAGGRFNAAGLGAELAKKPGKAIVILNFPNNPTGYMPGRAEVEAIRAELLAAAEAGTRIVAVIDDAYFGLVYDDEALAESPFGYLANLHPRILSIKLDAATKELFVWGLRCGFLTYGPPPVEEADALLAALEKKTMGAIRAAVSNSPAISQSIVLKALRSPTLKSEREAKLATLRARAEKVREEVERPEYQDSWDVHPFNAGYFMCIRVKGVSAEALRVHLLEQYGIGVIALGEKDIRVAFSSLELADIAPLFSGLHSAVQELRR